MNSIVLAAALNSGLRNGIGHTTLVSDEAATSDVCSSKIAYCAGIVRNSESDVFWGDQFVGVRSATTQKMSGRDAPEVFLAWNVDVGKLSPSQREHLLQWLVEWSSDRTELLEECAANRTSKTTAFSPTLNAWAATHCSKLPACVDETSPGNAFVSRPITVASPKLSRPMLPFLILAALMIAISAIFYIGKHIDRPLKVVDNVNPINADDERHKGETPSTGLSKKLQPKWKTDISSLQADVASGTGKTADLIQRLQELSNEIVRVASGDELEAAKKQVSQIANDLRSATVRSIDTLIPARVQELGTEGTMIDTSPIRSDVTRMERQLNDLTAIRSMVGNADVADDTGYAEKAFGRSVYALVLNKCGFFSKSQEIQFNLMNLDWLVQAGESDLAQVVEDEVSRNRIGKIMNAVAQLKKDVQIAVQLDDWNARPSGVAVELCGDAGKVIEKRSISLKSQGNAGAIGAFDGKSATFIGTFRVRCVDILRSTRVRLTFVQSRDVGDRTPATPEEIKVDSNHVSDYAWSARTVHNLRPPRPVKSGQVVLVVQDEILRDAFQTLGKLYADGVSTNSEK